MTDDRLTAGDAATHAKTARTGEFNGNTYNTEERLTLALAALTFYEQRPDLTKRDLDLIEVALESAISVCGTPFGSGDDVEDLGKEYAAALARLRQWRAS